MATRQTAAKSTPKKAPPKSKATKPAAQKQAKPKRQVGKLIPQKDMKALEASMAAEMAKDTSKRHRPFDDALLPEEKPAGSRTGSARWVLPTLFILALVALWVWFVQQNGSTSHEKGVKTALKNIETALTTQDVSSFDKHVNIPSLAGSIAGQMFSTPQVDGMNAPEFAILQERFDTLVKPALSEDIGNDLRALVRAEGLSQVSILSQLQEDLLPEAATIRVGEIQTTEGAATARMDISRPDLTLEGGNAVTLPLTLTLQSTDAANWQVTGVEDLNGTLSVLAEAESALRAETARKQMESLNNQFTLHRVSKAAIDDNTLLVGLEITNSSPQDMVAFTGFVTFADAAGRTLKSVPVAHNERLAAGEKLGKTWTISIDANTPGERHVLSLPMSALGTSFEPKTVTFAD